MHPKRNTQMRFTLFFIAFFLICFFSACNQLESPVKDTILFESYFIRYLASEQQIKAQAIFAEGDTITNTFPKSFAGGVSFFSSGMTERRISDKLIRFEETRKMPYPKNFIFKYKNDDNISTPYIARMSPIEDFFVQKNVNKSTGVDIVVKGELLKSNQSLIFLFSDTDNVAASIEVKGPVSSTTFHLPAKKLSNLNQGKGKLYLVKKQFSVETTSNRKIDSAIEYYTKDIEIDIVKGGN